MSTCDAVISLNDYFVNVNKSFIFSLTNRHFDPTHRTNMIIDVVNFEL